MQFRTEINPAPLGFTIEHSDIMMHIGSCFSEHIGNRFLDAGFEGMVNPMGQQYNLFSIAYGIQRIIQNKPYELSDLGIHQEVWYSFDHHSDFSGTEAHEVLTRINQNLLQSHEVLQKASYIFITPGTSHYYIYRDKQRIVSNCHKLPAAQFEMKMATVADNEAALNQIIQDLKLFNPNAKIILTVSPVRYAALGFPMNTYSKSSLILAIHQIIQKSAHIYYFPSYEMIMDDLRDYRFYNSDLLHPNEQAVQYIWEKFTTTQCSSSCLKWMEEVVQLHRASLHRPRQADTESHRNFILKNIEKTKALQTRLPHAQLTPILNRFEAQLKPGS